MMKMLPIALSAAALAAAAPCITQGQSNVAKPATKPAAKPAPSKSGHLAANGLNYYYEIHGTGEPLLLLHGGLGSIDMFRPVLPALAEAVWRDRHAWSRILYHAARTRKSCPKPALADTP